MSGLFFNKKGVSQLAMGAILLGLTGCPFSIIPDDPCKCNPEFLPFPEDGAMTTMAIREEHYPNDGEWQAYSWDDPDSPFADVLEMEATWEHGILTVDYITEEGAFQVVFETDNMQ
jgi:hypothetical protein